MLSPLSIIVSLVFVSQVIVISVLVPRGRERYYEELVRRCPPAEYPHLYPRGTSNWSFRGNLLRCIHYPIVFVASLLLAYAWIAPLPLKEFYALAITYLLIQMAPWFLTYYWDYQGVRAFRALPRPDIRRTGLTPRTLAALIPPWLIYLTAALHLCCIMLALYAGSSDVIAWHRVSRLAAGNGLMLGIIYWYFHKFMRSARDDAYESEHDFWVSARRNMRVFVSAALLAGGFSLAAIVLHMTAGPIDASAWIYPIASLVLQLVFIIEMRWPWHQLDHKDYSVYRVEALS